MTKGKGRPAQVSEYAQDYDDFNKWLDYWYQISLIKETNPKTILEIGKGTGTLELYMENLGYKFTSVDINESLKPDVVADITKLPFKTRSIDTVCAFEVLEHINFEEFETALKEMARVSKKYLVISIPYACFGLSFGFQMTYAKFLDSFFGLLRLKKFEPVYKNFAMPMFFLDKFGLHPEHAWEMGRKKYSKARIKAVFERLDLKIMKETDRMFNPYHYFFVLEKSK